MAEPHFIEDDEQERAREWWRANRLPIMAGIVIGLAIIIGTNAWKSWQQSQAEAASTLYARLLERDTAGDVAAAREAGEALIDEYGRTPYAGKAALILARISYEQKSLDDARQRLQWIIDNVRQFETINTARLRLAAIQFDQGEYELALKTLAIEDMDGFESHFYEMRGDIHARMGQRDKARDAYRAAIDGLAPDSLYEPVLRMKLDASQSGTAQ